MGMKRVLAALLLLTLAAPAWGQDFEKGKQAYQRGDFATALREWRPLAEQGDANAQTKLGIMYDKGQGVPKNHAEAAKWYRKAAEQGDADGQTKLGNMYRSGFGVPKWVPDGMEGRVWYVLRDGLLDDLLTTNRSLRHGGLPRYGHPDRLLRDLRYDRYKGSEFRCPHP